MDPPFIASGKARTGFTGLLVEFPEPLKPVPTHRAFSTAAAGLDRPWLSGAGPVASSRVVAASAAVLGNGRCHAQEDPAVAAFGICGEPAAVACRSDRAERAEDSQLPAGTAVAIAGKFRGAILPVRNCSGGSPPEEMQGRFADCRDCPRSNRSFAASSQGGRDDGSPDGCGTARFPSAGAGDGFQIGSRRICRRSSSGGIREICPCFRQCNAGTDGGSASEAPSETVCHVGHQAS